VDVGGLALPWSDSSAWTELASLLSCSGGWPAQTLGLAAGAMTVASYSVRNERAMLRILMGAMGLWAIHYGWLDAWTAALGSLAAAVRLQATLWRPGDARITGAFAGVALLLSALSWEGLSSAAALAGMVLAAGATNHLTGTRLRLALIAVSALWVVHHILVGSLGGLATEAALTSVNLLHLWRGRALAHRPQKITPSVEFNAPRP